MLRVRWHAFVSDDQGRLVFPRDADGRPSEPFSGLAYHVEEGVVRALLVVTDGVATGASDDWLPIPEGGLRVDASLVAEEEDYGPQLFKGAPLTGAVYDFLPTGECIAETVYVDGRPTEESERTWYPTGAPRDWVGNGEAAAWFPDGRLQRRAAGGAMQMNLIVRDDGRLGGIYLADPTLLDLDTVRRMTFSDEVLLIGPSVDASLVRALASTTTLGAVPRLRVIETGAGAEIVEVLAALPGPRAVWLSRNAGLDAEDAARLERLRPEVAVHFEPPR
ncbi:MAG: hypothetical protein U0414_23410 [Polyangiaceae bacterium]